MNDLAIITLDQPNIEDFAAARNAELKKVKTEWVFFIDKDEKITPKLKQAILTSIASPDFDAYTIPRLDTFMGRQLHHGEPGHTRFIRLARRSFGSWVRPVHEVWEGKGRVGKIDEPILHDSHSSISSFLDKINDYSSLEAEYRYQSGMKSSLFKIAVYPIAKFKYNYLLRLGFLDGVPGIIMAMMMSFHSYLTWTKLYLLWHKN